MNFFSRPYSGPQDFSSPEAWQPAAQSLVYGCEPTLGVRPPCHAFLKTAPCRGSRFLMYVGRY